jgi:hypothetical protein
VSHPVTDSDSKDIPTATKKCWRRHFLCGIIYVCVVSNKSRRLVLPRTSCLNNKNKCLCDGETSPGCYRAGQMREGRYAYTVFVEKFLGK